MTQRRRRAITPDDGRALLNQPVKESKLQANVNTLARYLSYRVNHNYDSRRSGPDNGLPDTYIAGNGRSIWAELKTERNKLSPAQLAWRDVILAAGHEWYCWRPRDWANGTVERVLMAHLNKAA